MAGLARFCSLEILNSGRNLMRSVSSPGRSEQDFSWSLDIFQSLHERPRLIHKRFVVPRQVQVLVFPTLRRCVVIYIPRRPRKLFSVKSICTKVKVTPTRKRRFEPNSEELTLRQIEVSTFSVPLVFFHSDTA